MPTSINNLGTALGGTSSTQNSAAIVNSSNQNTSTNTATPNQPTYGEAVILSLSTNSQTSNNGGTTGSDDAPQPAEKEVAIIWGDRPPKDHLYNGNTAAEENSERNRLWAESSYEERVEAEGLMFSKVIDGGNGLTPIANRPNDFPLPPNPNLQAHGIEGARLYPDDFGYILSKHSLATTDKTAFYSEFLNPISFFAAILGPALANAERPWIEGDRITFEAQMPYAVGYDHNNVPLYRVRVILNRWGSPDPSHPRVYNAYPVK